MNTIVWLNTDEYSYLELYMFFAGAVSWVMAYVLIVRDIYRYKYVGIPVATISADIAWEVLWALVFKQNLGFLIQLGYLGWLVLDIFIVFNTFRYGYKQWQPNMRSYLRPLFTFSIIAWFVVLYFFIKAGYDNPIGANSAYFVQILISSSYIMLLLRIDKVRGKLNVASNWLRSFGSFIIGIMCIMHWPQNTWMASMIVISALLDAYFLILIHQRLKQENKAVSVAKMEYQ